MIQLFYTAMNCTDAPAINQTNVNGAGDDVFSSFLSAAPTSTTSSAGNDANGSKTTSGTSKSEEESNFFDQPTPLPQEKSKMTKDSILALYGTPSHQPTIYGIPGKKIKITESNILMLFTIFTFTKLFLCNSSILYYIFIFVYDTIQTIQLIIRSINEEINFLRLLLILEKNFETVQC
jgi:hypothetical protein